MGAPSSTAITGPARAVGCAAILIGPVLLAFFAGGYSPEPQAWAGLIAWVLAAVALLVAPLPGSRVAWLVIGALALLTAWTALSILWAPVAGSAYHAAQLDAVYLGGLIAAAGLLRGERAIRALEPALAAGALVVVGYGLSERWLPGLLHFQVSVTASGRLEQPLTYWNAMGELAAIGLVLCARIGGDQARPRTGRALALAACAPLGLGLYLSFSRGALYAALAGLVALVALMPRRAQLYAIGLALVTAALAAATGAPFGGVTALTGAPSSRESQGAIALALVVVVTVAAGVVGWVLAGRSSDAPVRLPRRAGLLALVVICAGLALAIALGAHETTHQASLGGGASRLSTLRSDRYAYWAVALKAFASQPLHGVGAGGWAVWWLRDRTISGFAADAHSLPLQTLAELGLVGLALLIAWVLGLAAAGVAAYRRAPQLVAGPLAGLVVYAVHAPLDWDWQLPALTLVAVALAGAVLSQARPVEDVARR